MIYGTLLILFIKNTFSININKITNFCFFEPGISGQKYPISISNSLRSLSNNVLNNSILHNSDSASNLKIESKNEVDLSFGAGSEFELRQAICLSLYLDMLRCRALEEAIPPLYYQKKIGGFVHLYTGQEAISAGVIGLLQKSDVVVSTYREHAHACSKNVPIKEIVAELFGKNSGASKGRGGSMHIFSKEHNMIGGFAFIGEQIPIALGTALKSVYNSIPPHNMPVTVVFMGDATTNIGQFYESLNLAATKKLPVIFVIENNNWYSLHRNSGE